MTRGATEPIKYLQAQFEQHSSLLVKLDALHWHIIGIVAGTAKEAVHERYWDEFENSYYQLVGDVAAHIQCAQNPVVPPNIQSLQIANISPAASEALSLIKLPAISLPQFHSSLGEWVHFRDSFKALINRNEALSNIERFHYLKSAVQGEAVRALKTLPVSDNHYEAAWEALCKRYQDIDELIDHHVGALVSIKNDP